MRPEQPGTDECGRGFTRLGLLVLLSVPALLVAVAIPVRGSTGAAKSLVCMENPRRLSAAWMRYADEHDGRFVGNYHGGLVTTSTGSEGAWAQFQQRHLCHTLVQNHWFLRRLCGVPEAAADFVRQTSGPFEKLRLYPFVQRAHAEDEKTYRQAVDAAVRVIAQTPKLVPAALWNRLYEPPPATGPITSAWGTTSRNAGMPPRRLSTSRKGSRRARMPSRRPTTPPGWCGTTSRRGPMRLLVWNGIRYLEASADPPRRRFGAAFDTYLATP